MLNLRKNMTDMDLGNERQHVDSQVVQRQEYI